MEDDEGDGETSQNFAQKYKSSTFLADQEYDSMTMKGCVFLATCIKIDGKKWGVLLLDSTDPKLAPSTNNRKSRIADFEHTADMLTMLLK